MDGALVAFISRYGLTPYDFTVEGADRMERKLLNASLEEKALVELIKQYLRGF
jgi:hypothetical protein